MFYLKNQFVVIGLGRFGASVAETLINQNHEVLVIDEDMDMVESFMNTATLAVQADATDENVLKELGVHNYECAIVAIGEDRHASILVTLLLKEINVRTVISKAQDARHGKMLEKIGADRVIFPERDMGERLARQLGSSNLIEHINLSSQYDFIEITAPKSFRKKTIDELSKEAPGRFKIVAVKKNEDVNILPPGTTVIEQSDIVLMIGEINYLKKLSD